MTLLLVLIVFLIVFFIIKFLVKKFNIGPLNLRTPIILISSMLVTAIMITVIFIIMISIATYYPKEDFSKINWVENSDKRYTMSQDLIESEILIGLGRDEVITLLGTDFYSQNESLIYRIGYVPGILVLNPDILIIQFENGIVKSVKQDIANDF